MEERKKTDLPEKPKTPQQLWYNHEKKTYMKLHPEVPHTNTQWGGGGSVSGDSVCFGVLKVLVLVQTCPLCPQVSPKELKDALRRQWSQLSDKRRLKWISKALELQKDYEVPEPPGGPAVPLIYLGGGGAPLCPELV